MSIDFLTTNVLSQACQLFDLDGYKASEVSAHIGGSSDAAAATLREYLALFDFSALAVVPALRLFLSKFSLQGEAHQTDRILHGFSKRLNAQNPPARLSVDELYTLVVAIVMLNGDLHNPNNRNKMTAQEFRRNLESASPTTAWLPAMLKNIYSEVKADEIVQCADTADDGLGPGSDAPGSLSAAAGAGATLPPEPRVIGAAVREALALDCDKLGPRVFEGTLARKNMLLDEGKSTSSFKRAWVPLYGVIYDGHLLLAPVQKLSGSRVADRPPAYPESYMLARAVLCLPVRHSLAAREFDYAKRPCVFRFSTAAGAVCLLQASNETDMLAWIGVLNEIAAYESAPPLPAPVGSSKVFRRPLVSYRRSNHATGDQLASTRARLEKVIARRQDLLDLDPPLSKVDQDEVAYLSLEIAKLHVYVDLLAAKVATAMANVPAGLAAAHAAEAEAEAEAAASAAAAATAAVIRDAPSETRPLPHDERGAQASTPPVPRINGGTTRTNYSQYPWGDPFDPTNRNVTWV